jgi:thymidylate synthase (FAD)
MSTDPYFKVVVLNATPNPQTTIWQALHQDYSENFVAHQTAPGEERAGEIAVKRLLAGKRGHYGPLEHVQIVFNVGWFPHDVMQQARTHRVGVSFDVQSGRYTGQRIIDVANEKRDLEEVFYLRPCGEYTDRSGNPYVYDEDTRKRDVCDIRQAAHRYAEKVAQGMSEEQARHRIGYDIRQHFVVSFSLRALWHFLTVRGKDDAQLEIRQLSQLLLPEMVNWVPQLGEWYVDNLWKKGLLAP